MDPNQRNATIRKRALARIRRSYNSPIEQWEELDLESSVNSDERSSFGNQGIDNWLRSIIHIYGSRILYKGKE